MGSQKDLEEELSALHDANPFEFNFVHGPSETWLRKERAGLARIASTCLPASVATDLKEKLFRVNLRDAMAAKHDFRQIEGEIVDRFESTETPTGLVGDSLVRLSYINVAVARPILVKP